ncbi:TetR/AcrR family transcriptional regulator [Solicola gregarius]|uniref:TetR/AcrR family transcriptional regulator n=1 Tax=Solicola gregarius TaxID=2908642 RepID=A0AA46TGS3_9ACTN|nr:TetR/AcrR family transcriptional regulator [Solicola gregarius]UYM05041.1 TetR/AcrR family transcriptional regulator [Solicola gregarius]
MSTTTTERLTPAGERILASASKLFYEHGINAVGVDRIADEAGTTKKTLYDRFGSKEGLTLAYLRRRYDTWRAFLADYLDAHPDAGHERVLAVFDAIEAWMRANTRGCGFINAYAELAGTGHSGLDVVLEEKAGIRALYVGLVGELGVDAPDRLGGQLALLHEGAIIATTAGNDPGAIALARETAEELVRNAT